MRGSRVRSYRHDGEQKALTSIGMGLMLLNEICTRGNVSTPASMHGRVHRDTRHAVRVRVFIKLCLHSLLSRRRPGKGAAVQGGGVRVRWEVEGEWDEVRDACNRGYMDVGVDVDVNVDVDVVERRRQPLTLTWLGSHRPGLGLRATPVERDVLGTRGSFHPCHLRSVIPSADRGRHTEANMTGPDGKKTTFYMDRMERMVSRARYYYLFLYFYHMGRYVGCQSRPLGPRSTGPYILTVDCSVRQYLGGNIVTAELPTRHRNAAATNCNGTALVSHWQGPSSRFPDRLARIISSPTTRRPWLSAGPSPSCSTGIHSLGWPSCPGSM